MKRICVFCGSNSGARSAYRESTRDLARLLVARKIEVVYGGSSAGLMKVLADSVQEAGGTVIGVITRDLVDKEIAHDNLDELHTVNTLSERKAMMAELADGFIALPGGLGTLDEFLEVVTWAQLGLHDKPCGLLNVAGYYDRFLEFFEHAAAERLVRHEHRNMILAGDTPEELLEQFETYQAPEVAKWLD